MSVPIFGIVSAIAIPNFVKFGARSKQAEAKMLLRMSYTMARSFHVENDRWPKEGDEVGELNRVSQRYAVFAPWKTYPATPMPASEAELRRALPPEVLTIEESEDGVMIFAVGNIDNDATLDVWSIATHERYLGNEEIHAGEPFHHVDDVAK